jgi:DNA-binding Lrp family transcriptional regulator
MTPRQSAALNFIRDYAITHGGVYPTLEEIAAHLGRSLSAAKAMIERMVRGGVLVRPGPKSAHRNIRLANSPTEFEQGRAAGRIEGRTEGYREAIVDFGLYSTKQKEKAA